MQSAGNGVKGGEKHSGKGLALGSIKLGEVELSTKKEKHPEGAEGGRALKKALGEVYFARWIKVAGRFLGRYCRNWRRTKGLKMQKKKKTCALRKGTIKRCRQLMKRKKRKTNPARKLGGGQDKKKKAK